MKIHADLNYLRMSPRKVRLVANAVRGRSVAEAKRALMLITRRAAVPLEKLIRSAVANATHNFRVSNPDSFTISEVVVGAGPTLKRRRARARSRAFPIAKRTSHIHLVLETAERLSERRRPRKSDIQVVADTGAAQVREPAKVGAEREAFRVRPRVATKPRAFVERMFRRKAI